MKRFFQAIIVGAGTYVGYLLGKGICSLLTDPIRKAKIKKKMNNVKTALKD